ncbi:MAG: sulfite exporter TauE/SafE family protein, partial [Marinosulfonomonas sp.]|nr:sulfite exporter TauE/SafE family protein [Marinosulfonomonas sp.]
MPDITTLLPMVAMLLAIGAFAGVMAGLLGVGGGIILVPAYFYIFSALGHGGDQLMQVCLATSLATIIITSLRSVSSHHKKGAVDWGILRGFAPGIIVGAAVGVLVAASLRSVVLQGIFGVLGIIVGLYLGFGRDTWRLGSAMPTGLRR